VKALNNHIILSFIAFVATNIYFVLWFLIDAQILQDQVTQKLSFFEFVGITNGALIIISMFSITYRKFGDLILQWGYSNLLRFVILVTLSAIIFVVACIVLFTFHFYRVGTEDIFISIKNSINNSYYIPLVFFFIVISMLMFFISNLERRSGSISRLLSQSMGKTIEPRMIYRGFIFIDLNDATSLAERLGSTKYANLLRDCFQLLNELIAVSPFEVYQYVGDEAVVTWGRGVRNADLLAIHLFSDFKAYLKEKRIRFLKLYGVQPVFKCAIHSGDVIESEIGKGVKHLVYHGDVLNTTSRLLSQCHANKSDLIISESTLKSELEIRQTYTLQRITHRNLKGKLGAVNAYKVSENKNEHKPKTTSKIFLIKSDS